MSQTRTPIVFLENTSNLNANTLIATHIDAHEVSNKNELKEIGYWVRHIAQEQKLVDQEAMGKTRRYLSFIKGMFFIHMGEEALI